MESCNGIPADRKRKRDEMEAVTNEEEKDGGGQVWVRSDREVSAAMLVEDRSVWDRVAAMLEEDRSVWDPLLEWERLPCDPLLPRQPWDPLLELECPGHVDSMHGEVTAVTNEEEKQEGEEQKDRVVAMLEELQSGRWNGIDSPPGQAPEHPPSTQSLHSTTKRALRSCFGGKDGDSEDEERRRVVEEDFRDCRDKRSRAMHEAEDKGEVTAVTNEEEKQEGEEQKDRVVAMLEELQSGRWNGIDSPPGQEA
jgi:hypothetical protein